jgi:hypothetical protein
MILFVHGEFFVLEVIPIWIKNEGSCAICMKIYAILYVDGMYLESVGSKFHSTTKYISVKILIKKLY